MGRNFSREGECRWRLTCCHWDYGVDISLLEYENYCRVGNFDYESYMACSVCRKPWDLDLPALVGIFKLGGKETVEDYLGKQGYEFTNEYLPFPW